MMADLDKLISDYNSKNAPEKKKGTNEAFENANPVEFFLRSAGSSMIELFGAEPSDYVKKGRQEMPGAGLASEMVGGAVPYFGWAGMASKATKLPKIAKAIDKLGDADENPISTGFKRGTAVFAPFEAGRVAGHYMNDQPMGDILGNAGANLLIEGAGGAIFGALRAAGTRNLKGQYGLEQGQDLKQPSQLLYRDLQKKLDGGELPDDQLSQVKHRLSTYEKEIRTEMPQDKKTFVGKLQGDGDARAVNRVYKAATKGSISSRRLIVAQSDGFIDEASRNKVIKDAGLEGNLQYTQFPRYVKADSKKAAKNIETNLMKQGKMQTLDEGLLYSQEESGMYVFARKIEGEVGTPSDKDKWVMFKTDSPEKFAPDRFKFSEIVRDRAMWLGAKDYKPTVENELAITDELYTLMEDVPLMAYTDASRRGLMAKGWDEFAKATGLEKAAQSEILQRSKETFRDYLAPAMHQFKSNPRANWTWALSKMTHDKARAMAHRMTYGDEIVEKGQNLFGKLLYRQTAGANWKDKPAMGTVINNLDDGAMQEVLNAWRQQLGLEDVTKLYEKGEISDKAYEALKQVQDMDDYLVDQVQRTQRASGVKEFEALKGHYMVSRAWDGDLRVPIKDEAGRVVYVAAGKNKKAAETRADEIVKAAEEQGMALTREPDAMIFGAEDDIELARQLRIGGDQYKTLSQLDNRVRTAEVKPKEFKKRTGVEGYKADFTKKELLDRLYSHTYQRTRYMANLSVNHLMEGHLEKLRVEDPKLFNALIGRLNTLAGTQGELAKKQNQLVDKVMAPVLGKNSATKIAGTMNSYMHHMQLAMFNLAYPTLNALTFMQTTLPKVSFLMSAEAPTLQRHFSFLPMMGSDSKPRGEFGFMDMMKLVRNSFKEMKNPDEVLRDAFSKGIRDGVVDPKFVEEYAGENAGQIVRLKEVLQGDEGVVDWIKEVSNFLPAVSEKMGRGHTFVTGHMVGRDFFNLEGERLYRFAKEFTEQTMFNYSQADRARVMTAPLGSMFGLFKNWQTHYIASMMEYMGEGVARGNWKPLMWMMGGTSSIGGVAATPLYTIANSASEWMTDESLMTNLYESWGGTNPDEMGGGAVDALYMGLPAFLGGKPYGTSSNAP